MVFIFSLTLLQVPGAFSKTFTIGIHERPFYREKSAGGSWSGVDIDLVTAIFKQSKHEFQLVELPWKRTLIELQTGKIDIALSAAKTEERMQYAYFSASSFRPGHNVLYIDVRKQNRFKQVQSLQDLLHRNFKIGVIRGVSYSDSYDALLRNKQFVVNLVVLDSTARLPHMLLKGRIDGYLDSEFGGTFKVNDNPLFKQKIIAKMKITNVEEAQTYLMFSKKSVTKEDVNVINLALDGVLAEGQLERIIARYGL